jgi:hypothetical protein
MIEKGVALETAVAGAEDVEIVDGLKERSSVRKDA